MADGARRARLARQDVDEDDDDDGFGDQRFPTAAPHAPDTVLAPREVASETAIDSIRREGLTGRQLRMARRMAQRNGMAVTSDFDAVRQLRARGIDPFQRSSILELVVADDGDGGQGGAGLPARTDLGAQRLPATIKPAQVPSTEVNAPAETPERLRARDIMRIQRDIARRRRRRMVLMGARLAFFVGLPTFLAGFYFYKVATPLYASYSAFVIQKAEPGAAAAGQLGGLVAGTTFANSQDSINVQQYLQSRDAMNRLDKDNGFKQAFEGPKIDPILRLPSHATNEETYDLYQRMVKIGYDPTEGSIKMEVIAPTGQEAAGFSRALISYAEQQVDHMTQRIREDQMTGARQSYEGAEKKLAAAQEKVVNLQQKFKVLSSTIEETLLTNQITALDSQLNQAKLTMQELMSNPNPPQARVQPLQRRIDNIEARIRTLRNRMTQNTSQGVSLATVQSDLLSAQADVQTRQMMLSQALQSLETARAEANRQVRYLSLSVSPVAADHPTYPRAFENTLVAFLIFAGLYLMVSMTVSILREQVSG
ncbi:capsule polysaccharide transporter [Defluviimonas sp. 20V17]|uniref:Capsular polysaccharide transport system permease protein n=2 Tax=Allgaiera indica TaxID=765699 RepID=A0AAN4UU81_9RHOB|nr:capsule polysaccharide transporter [Defluviimonas sp. 20V17]GHE04167.1 capsule polysaccharide transporter [Allgaiera indica]SDX50237.1 capsular polysaccharide transport system permease protein [Allgaiera indica]